MISVKELNTFYIHSDFDQHRAVKNGLLKRISESAGDKIVAKTAHTNITKSDWNLSDDFVNREWVTYILPDLKSHFIKCFKKVGYYDYIIKKLWYQQYKKDSEHGWHIHGENFTGVYYVNLPDNRYKTEFLEPLNNEKINSFNVNEGDLIIFPSYIIHRAPKILDDFEKTIISFNIEVCYPDSHYKLI